MNNKIINSSAKIIFGIGSNLGDREHNLKIALQKLTNNLHLKDLKVSKIFKNPAMLPPNAPAQWNIEFYNIVASSFINIEKYPPLKILEIIKAIEKEIGRNSIVRWSPREIDIDILAIEDMVYESENNLKIPHEGLFVRDFFYKPMQEIEPELFWKIRQNLQKN